MNCSIGEWFRTTVGVWQRLLFSPTPSTFSSIKMMSGTLKEYDGKVSVGAEMIPIRPLPLTLEEQELEDTVKNSTKPAQI